VSAALAELPNVETIEHVTGTDRFTIKHRGELSDAPAAVDRIVILKWLRRGLERFASIRSTRAVSILLYGIASRGHSRMFSVRTACFTACVAGIQKPYECNTLMANRQRSCVAFCAWNYGCSSQIKWRFQPTDHRTDIDCFTVENGSFGICNLYDDLSVVKVQILHDDLSAKTTRCTVGSPLIVKNGCPIKAFGHDNP
jgi:hypothetical protein